MTASLIISGEVDVKADFDPEIGQARHLVRREARTAVLDGANPVAEDVRSAAGSLEGCDSAFRQCGGARRYET